MIRRIITNPMPASTDAGLLIFRVLVFLLLFAKHGYEKLFTFSEMSPHFPSLFHMGSTASLFMAMLGDGICTLLIVVGFATRWAALYSFSVIFVAWAFVHHFLLFGKGADHGELIWLYLCALLLLIVSGPGRFSIDARLSRSSSQ